MKFKSFFRAVFLNQSWSIEWMKTLTMKLTSKDGWNGALKQF
jgi:hypothetical protein